MDFLGLRTLTIVERALELIEKDHPNGLPPRKTIGTDGNVIDLAHPTVADRSGRIDLEKADLTDQSVYRGIFQKGQTKGVFQFESPGMRELLIRMKPDRIEDLIAANALYRPGPMDLIPDYCDRKHGRQKVPQVHPLIDKLLAETYGIMVYQEQVMRIFNQLGNIPLARAYKIIKAISKKHTDVIAAEKQYFLKGAQENGIKPEQAESIFALIEKFGAYGFNKSHSTRYAIVAFQTAYLKTYFPLQYMAALLTFEMGDQSKTIEYIEECRYIHRPDGRVGIQILPPDVNSSIADFGVVRGTIRFGLAAVKGVGEKAVQAIIDARQDKQGMHRAFTSLYDFCERVDLRCVNKSVLESLIKCGAFDSLHPIRAAAFAAVEHSVSTGGSAQEARRAGQENLFGGGGTASGAAPAEYKLPAVTEWSQSEKMSQEKAVLGFYVTSHPLRTVDNILPHFTTLDSQSLLAAADKKEGIIGGLISKVDVRIARSGQSAGQKWATLVVEDLRGTMKVLVYGNEYQRFASLIQAEAIVFIRGRVNRSREEPSFQAGDFFSPPQVMEKLAHDLVLTGPAAALDEAAVDKLSGLLHKHPGQRVGVRLKLVDQTSTPPMRVLVDLRQKVNLTASVLQELQDSFPQFRIQCTGPGSALFAARARREVASAAPAV